MKKLDLLDELSRRASKIVYARSSVSILSPTIILVNMALIHEVTNSYMDELSKYLSTTHLPKANFFPQRNGQARKLIKKLGLAIGVIKTCPSRCILY
jgi:hypothetical protein